MGGYPVIRNCSYCLAHVPDLVRYGSKPRREINSNPDIERRITSALRTYSRAVCYPPNQTYVGNLSPEELAAIPRPWFSQALVPEEASLKQRGPFGEILDQRNFYALLKLADVLNPPLCNLNAETWNRLKKSLASHPVLGDMASRAVDVTAADAGHGESSPGALPLQDGDEHLGYFQGDVRAEGRDDPNLLAPELLENLCTKASGTLAVKWLCNREAMDPNQIDLIISCGEEACGDRYQRGGGGMAKAIAEMSGCRNATGMDIKNFCAGPVSALLTAAAMVHTGLFKRVVVVGGGSLAKLGMKFQAFLQHDMIILDDCLASMAFLVHEDDGRSPMIRLQPGAIGVVPVGASMADESVFRHYLLQPLENLGLKCTDIDKFAPELQNPEIMEFAGSGDVALKNYRKIAAIAVRANQLDKNDMTEWINRIGMPGFAPTQGHIPSAVPFIGHAMEAMRRGEMRRVMFLARASLFLNRCTTLLDGVSFLLERNPALDEQ